ncbi:MAG: hypothetical protein INQ03_18300 [Candidatus Heimdallarchaeota archaeon]|nr:hypothetical protein [Candidatus Heimdallarchaeota archaeon]
MSKRSYDDMRVQRTKDFFKSAQRNIFIVVWMIRILAASFLVFLFNTVYNILIPEVKVFSDVGALFQLLFLYFFVVVVALLTFVGYVASPLSSQTEAVHYLWSARAFIINNLFGSPGMVGDMTVDQLMGGSEDPLAPLAYLMNKPQRLGYEDQVTNGFIMLIFILMFVTGLRFISR